MPLPPSSNIDEIAKRREQQLFLVSVALLTGLTLWPIWSLRLLPMQDYPQHLFLSQILATFDDPSFDWKTHYQIDLGLRPYMLWYVVMKPLTGFVGVEAAGRLVFTLYVALIAALVLGTNRQRTGASATWGVLLLYPFAFNQTYFMGFANYTLSLPILFLAIRNLEDLANGPLSTGTMALHALYLVILLLNHPYTVLVYVGLAGASALAANSRAAVLRTLAPSAVAVVVFLLWYLTIHGPSAAPRAYKWDVQWWPVWRTAQYFALMFTGMRWQPRPDWLPVGVWAIAAIALTFAWSRAPLRDGTLRRPLLLVLASLAGLFVLPSWFGYYSYFNVRLAPVAYFAFALLLGRLAIGLRSGLVIAGCSALLVGLLIRTQARVSDEAQEVLSACAHVDRNALILPLMFDASSEYLDSYFFFQAHAHEASYCHILAGGGADPDLFRSSMIPVQYRPGVVLPTPANPLRFKGNEFVPRYDYVLARGAPASFAGYLSQHADLSATSGRWQLFKNRSPAIP